MPRPVDALPCGSRSTISTFSPIAASAVPRLMAVVVLPTPPFWLARARTRGLTAVSVMRAAPGEAKVLERQVITKIYRFDARRTRTIRPRGSVLLGIRSASIVQDLEAWV